MTACPRPSVRSGVARRLVTEACTRWHLPHLADPAGLVVTELVTNAVVHAGTGIELIIARAARRLHLAIRDYARAHPRLARPEETPPAAGA